MGTGTAGTGVYNMSAGSLTVTNQFSVGRNGASGQWNISGGSATLQNQITIGSGGGTGTVTQSGSSVINPAGAVGGANLQIGNDSSSTGVYNLQAGTLNAWDIRPGYGGSGAFNQSGGTANLVGWFRIGMNAGSSGTCNLLPAR